MKTDDFDYDLPERLIAQTPLINRDEARLMVLDKKTGDIKHQQFSDIVDYLNEGDIIVVNDTKVIPARLYGIKETTNAHVEVLLLKDQGNDIWECLMKPARRITEGTIISFGDGLLKAQCVAEFDEGIRHIKLIYTGILYEILDKLGTMPLPPYIKEKLDDQDMYQTVYAKNIGSAAAPTAGLHFTEELLNKIKDKGIKIVPITLHVGLGTFRPVNVEDVTKHKMHTEYYEISESSARIIENARLNHQRIISVGTTTTRTLETVMTKHNKIISCQGWTDIFIYPGYQFKIVDSLITNFHLPKSTLIMLVSALSKKEYILNAYNEAVKHEYRFFSFGDAMFIK